MKRQDYEKPTMKVIQLKQRMRLLQTNGEKPDYKPLEWE